MTLDEAREKLAKVLEVKPSDPTARREMRSATQDGCDLVLEVGDETLSYEVLKKLARAFKTDQINFENSTCEQGYYGEHSDGHTTLRIAGILDPPPPPKYERLGGGSRGGLPCSFCGKGSNEVKKLIAGPSVYICNECVKLCNDILREGGL